jgi:hypothetical protein
LFLKFITTGAQPWLPGVTDFFFVSLNMYCWRLQNTDYVLEVTDTPGE